MGLGRFDKRAPRRALLTRALIAMVALAPPFSIAADCGACAEWAFHPVSALEDGTPTTFIHAGNWLVHAIAGIVYVRDPTSGKELSRYPTTGLSRPPIPVDFPDGSEPHWYV